MCNQEVIGKTLYFNGAEVRDIEPMQRLVWVIGGAMIKNN